MGWVREHIAVVVVAVVAVAARVGHGGKVLSNIALRLCTPRPKRRPAKVCQCQNIV